MILCCKECNALYTYCNIISEIISNHSYIFKASPYDGENREIVTAIYIVNIGIFEFHLEFKCTCGKGIQINGSVKYLLNELYCHKIRHLTDKRIC